MNRFFITCAISVCLSLSFPLSVGAADISKKKAANIAQQVSPGRVLSVKRKGNVYKVKTLNAKGDVRIIAINANNGKVRGR